MTCMIDRNLLQTTQRSFDLKGRVTVKSMVIYTVVLSLNNIFVAKYLFVLYFLITLYKEMVHSFFGDSLLIISQLKFVIVQPLSVITKYMTLTLNGYILKQITSVSEMVKINNTTIVYSQSCFLLYCCFNRLREQPVSLALVSPA